VFELTNINKLKENNITTNISDFLKKNNKITILNKEEPEVNNLIRQLEFYNSINYPTEIEMKERYGHNITKDNNNVNISDILVYITNIGLSDFEKYYNELTIFIKDFTNMNYKFTYKRKEFINYQTDIFNGNFTEIIDIFKKFKSMGYSINNNNLSYIYNGHVESIDLTDDKYDTIHKVQASQLQENIGGVYNDIFNVILEIKKSIQQYKHIYSQEEPDKNIRKQIENYVKFIDNIMTIDDISSENIKGI